MTLEEVGALLALAARYDNRRLEEPTAEAWHLVLRDVGFDDAARAVAEHFATRPSDYLQVGHVVAGIRRIRAERLRRFGADTLLEAVPADPDDVETWVEQRRALTALVAAGEVDAGTPGPVLEAAVRRVTVRQVGSGPRREIGGAQ